MDIVTNRLLYKTFLKHTVVKEDETIVEIRIPKFNKGSLEHFLWFLLEFKVGMLDLGYQNNSIELCRKFRAHVSNRLLSRFMLKYNELTNIGADKPDMDQFNAMIWHVLQGFGRSNILKFIKPHILTTKKPFGIS